MRQLQWDRKFITKVRVGLSVAVAVTVLIARRRGSLHRKAEEERVCVLTPSVRRKCGQELFK
jgi:hypothetical protein